MTKPEENLPLYANRWTFARYLAKDSPKLKYVAKPMGDICLNEADPRRVLIFTDWLMNQWNLEGFLGVSVQATVDLLRWLPANPYRISVSTLSHFSVV